MEPKNPAAYPLSIGSESPQPPTSPRMDKKLIAELWRRMTAMYGHKWASQYGECDADETWSIGLAGVTPDQLAAGLRHCLAVGADRARTGDRTRY